VLKKRGTVCALLLTQRLEKTTVSQLVLRDASVYGAVQVDDSSLRGCTSLLQEGFEIMIPMFCTLAVTGFMSWILNALNGD
jgi:hypothetical protein